MSWPVKQVPDWMVRFKLVGQYTSFASHFNKTIYLAKDLMALPNSLRTQAVIAHENRHREQGEQFKLGGIIWSICYGIGIPVMFLLPVFLALAIALSPWWLFAVFASLPVVLFSRNLRLEAELEAEAVELFARWRLQGFTDNPETLKRFVSADRLHVFGRPYWIFGIERADVTEAIVQKARKLIREHVNGG